MLDGFHTNQVETTDREAEALRCDADKVVGLIWYGQEKWCLTKEGLLNRVVGRVSVSGEGNTDPESDRGLLKAVDQVPLFLGGVVS